MSQILVSKTDRPVYLLARYANCHALADVGAHDRCGDRTATGVLGAMSR